MPELGQIVEWKRRKGASYMDLWFIIKERYMLLSVLLIITIVSLFLLLAIWKNRSEVPRSLTVIITVICMGIIILSLLVLVFAISFGYNS